MVAVPSDVQKLPILAPKKNASISPYKPRPYHNTGPKNREPKTGKNRESGVSIQFSFPVLDSRFFRPPEGIFSRIFAKGKKTREPEFPGKAGKYRKSRHPPKELKVERRKEDKGRGNHVCVELVPRARVR